MNQPSEVAVLEPSPSSFLRRNRLPIIIGAVVLVGVAGVIAVRSGARVGTKATTPKTTAAIDPWQRAQAALRRDTEVESCRRILLDLNSDLTKVPTAPQPAELGPDELTAITADLGLNEVEAKEIKPSAYSSLDAAYLAECIYLRDVAVSLDVSTLPPAKRANAAFQWVTRQIVLSPWVVQKSQELFEPKPPLSPSYVLRRGSGSGLERAYVFIELCRQLGLDAYFIGPPEAKTRAWWHRAGGDDKTPPKGPFWAVGVRAGNQILLFDPWDGEVLPFNLEQLRSQPAEFAERLAALAKANGVSVEELKKAEVFFSPQLSAFAPRLKLLEEKLEGERGVKLTANRELLAKNAKNALGGAAVNFWNPPNEQFTLTKTLGYILSESEGGFAANTPNGVSMLAGLYRISLLPGQKLFKQPQGLRYQEPWLRIVDASINRYEQSFFKPPIPRERFQRGQFAEATKVLVKEWEDYTKMTERTRSEADRQKIIAEWIEKANVAYLNLNGALNPNQVAEAQAEVNQFWKSNLRGLNLLAEQGLGPAGTGEAIFLLALCKQELAERLSGPDATDPAKLSTEARDAWLVAFDWWKRYGDFKTVQNESYPGRLAHAERLGARAERMSGPNR